MLKKLNAMVCLAVTFIAQSPAQSPLPPRTLVVQKGVVLKFATVAELSSATAKKGDEVPLRLTRPLTVDGITLLPIGAQAQGRVRKVKKAGPKCAWGVIEVEVSQVRFPDASIVRTEVWLRDRRDFSVPEFRRNEHEDLKAIPEIILYAPIVAPWFLVWLVVDFVTGGPNRNNPLCVGTGDEYIFPVGSTFGVVVVKKHRVQY